MSIYHRIKYNTENLTKDDFIHGIGYNLSLYNQILKIRNIQINTEHDYYHENSISIDGTIRIKKEHPLQNKILIDNRENKNSREIIIESIHKHWYFGYYWIIIYRIINTKSHGSIIYKNINSIDNTIFESIEETIKYITFKDNTLNWNIF
jgi:hypothetical protein